MKRFLENDVGRFGKQGGIPNKALSLMITALNLMIHMSATYKDQKRKRKRLITNGSRHV